MQLNDALIESYRAEIRTLDNLLEDDRGLPEIGCKGESSIPIVRVATYSEASSQFASPSPFALGRRNIVRLLCLSICFLFITSLIVVGQPAEILLAQEKSRDQSAKGGGAAEMARKLQDPLANIAALMTDNDILFKTGDDDTSYSFQLQPVYAFDFPEKGFTFLPRAVIPIIGAAPESDLPSLGEPRPSGGGTTWGLSDIITQFFFSPKTKSSWKWGIGPQLSWRTRTDDKVGGPGWGAGAAGVLVGNFTEQLSFAGILNQLWSYDGDFSTMGFQPNLYYNFKSIPGAYVAYNASISVDWKAASSNTWTVPLGAIVGRTFDMGNGYGLDLSTGPYWNVVKPDGAADWFLKIGVTLLFPK